VDGPNILTTSPAELLSFYPGVNKNRATATTYAVKAPTLDVATRMTTSIQSRRSVAEGVVGELEVVSLSPMFTFNRFQELQEQDYSRPSPIN
jgi:hypothetical protein